MADWVLIPCLKALFAEFNRIAPSRDKASDGSIGDTAHQQSVSDHNRDEEGSVPIHDADKVNEVHAIDVDNNLRIGAIQWGALTFGDPMEAAVQFLLGRCRSGAERRLRYVIYNRRIWSASSDWVQKAYTGPSPHTEHAHFSASYETNHEASTASWHLEEIPVALTAADKTWLSAEIKKQAIAAVESQRDDIANDVWHKPKFAGTETAGSAYQRTPYDCVADTWSVQMKGVTRGGDAIPPAGLAGKLDAYLADQAS